MSFNLRNVIILPVVFIVLNFPDSSITSDERMMGQKTELMLKEMYENGYEMEEKEKESLDFQNPFNVLETEEIELIDEEENYACNVKEISYAMLIIFQ